MHVHERVRVCTRVCRGNINFIVLTIFQCVALRRRFSAVGHAFFYRRRTLIILNVFLIRDVSHKSPDVWKLETGSAYGLPVSVG